MRLLHVLWLALVLATPLAAQDTPRAPRAPRPTRTPPALEVYKGRRIAQTMHYLGAEWLTRDNREQEERCSLLLTNLGVKRLNGLIFGRTVSFD